jgi:dinuclear metal center YbgI/SA1388 family protein
MATVREIYHVIDGIAPFSTQLGFDNAGFLLGHTAREVRGVLVALDARGEVIDEAIDLGVELLVTHHPVIWEKLSAVTDENLTGQKLLRLAEHGVAVISAHTNLDASEGGVNSLLSAALGLRDCVPLEPAGADARGHAIGIGRVGIWDNAPGTLEDFAETVKIALGLQGVRVMDAGQTVHRVAAGGGSCGSLLPLAAVMGCDTFVTADLKHDIYLDGKQLGVNLIDAGHYGTEALVVPVLAKHLQAAFPDLSVHVTSREREVFRWV